MVRRLWTRDEFMIVFNLYLKIPFGKMYSTNPDVKRIAALIGRTEGSVALRLVNFASCDPILQRRGIKGMSGGSKQCQPYWDEFFADKDKFVFESEQILARYQKTSLESKYKESLLDISDDLTGEDKERVVKTRVNQNVFRTIILANYDSTCALSGIDIPELLVASHIMPWADNKEERLNPENGICLSSLYDKAFDKGLITFSDDYKTILSRKIKANVGKTYYADFFEPIDGKQLLTPEKYFPNKRFLEYHRDVIFIS